MCDAHGREVIGDDGRKYRHKLGSDDLSAAEAASLMAKDIKAKFKIAGRDRVSGFEPGPIQYPKDGSIW
jgi:hypothetical protein